MTPIAIMPILIIQPSPPSAYPTELRLRATVGPFVPIEERMPKWDYARTYIQAMVPRHLRVEPRDKESLRLDTQWVNELFEVTPPDERGAVSEMFNNAGAALAEYFSPLVQEVVGRRLCQALVTEVDARFTEADYWNIAAGRPTARDYILHCFGIDPITTPPDEEPQQDHAQEVH